MSASEFDSGLAPAAIADRGSRWLHRFAWFTAIATLLLICSGGMVTSKGVGLAVPDWPTTFGYNMFRFPISKWVGGIFFEHTHRLIASIVGFLTIVLAIWIWRVDHRRWLRNLGFAALGAVILQGVLGGLRVTLLKDEIGVFHALLAQAFLGMVIVITLATSSRLWRRLSRNSSLPARVRALCRVVICTTIVIYLQLGLGATMRHQHRDLSILDFPLAYGKLIPDTSPAKVAEINTWRDARAMSDVTPFHIWLQMTHRFVAAVIAAGVIASLFLARRTGGDAGMVSRFADFWFLLLAFQIALGAWVIWSNKAADIATAHVAVGATMFALGVSLSAICLRLLRDRELSASPRQAPVSMEIPVS
ncbi:MAG: cytochrome oxidase biogenesis protein CtaA [Verrucomicrobia bacterium]|nr:MAG: cytochrome oxidase biogenesis protein CtaA [Verrucomicrobiota bacterium]